MIIAGQWEVIEPLGEGGMGMVYKVRHYQMEEYVLAIKMLSPELMDNQGLVARFYREGSVMSRFRHKHIVRVFSAGAVYEETLRRHYILMEYIQGKTLRDHVRDIKKGERKPFSLAEVLEISRQIAEALAHAHNQTPPIVHRDIKPGNIMIEDPTKDFPLGRAVLMDWGIAKELKDSDDTQLTGMWMMVGTPKYCSPEQMRPLDTITGSADVYSLGMVIYEMYTGKQFFADLDTESVVRKVRDDPDEFEPRFDQPTPPEFAALIRKAIAKSRTRRYQRMEELLHDLGRCRDVIEEHTATTVIHSAPAEVEDREGLRRRLEEQQRGLTLELQQETKRVRERAASEGAVEWAAAVFQQAALQEEEGARRLEERNYFPAQDAYNEAIRLFDRAREEAVAVALRNAEQLRNEMLTAKAEAERYRAREKARRFYTSGLAFENEASELWEQKRYRQAGDIFTKAKNAFEDARELAGESLRGEIEAARQRAEENQRNAVIVEAAELARISFEEAERKAKEAAKAFAQEDFTQAHQLYEIAARQYEQAQQQAQSERQRREILAAQRRAADEARERVRASRTAGEPLRLAAEEQWAAARQWEQQGEAGYQREQYEEALRAFEQAIQGYEKAREEAEKLRRAAGEGQTQAERAREAAQQAQASEYAEEHFQEGEESQLVASRHYEAGRYRQAVEHYEAAARQYRDAQTRAGKARQLFAQAVERKQQAAEAQQAAAAAQAELYAPELFNQAQTTWGQGEQHLSARRWAQAGEAFAQAQGLFVRVRQEARKVKRQARKEAEAARERAMGAQQEAMAGEQHFPERWGQAVALIEQATQALTTEDYQAAQSGFAQGMVQFQRISEAVREIAEREALKAAAEAAQGCMQESRDAAVVAEAVELAGELFAAAEGQAREATAALMQETFARARELYEKATQCYAQAQQSAQAERQRRERIAAQRRAADDTYQQVVLAKTAGEAFAHTTEAQWAEAQQWEARGEEAYRNEQYEETRQAYEKAAQAYEQVRVTGERHRQAAEAARAQAEQAREAAYGAQALEYAAELFQQGEANQQAAGQGYESGRYGEATAHYEAAQQAYQAARREAAAARRRYELAIAAKERAELVRREADAVRAGEYAQEPFQHALTAQERGEAYLNAERWQEAEDAFARAQTLFMQVRQEAEEARERVRQAAEAARQQTASARRRAASGESLFPERWAQAVAVFEHADHALAQEDYRTALAEFEKATIRFQEIFASAREMAEREALKAAAEAARGEADACRAAAITAEAAELAAALFAEAERNAAEAAVALTQEQFADAQRLYEAATERYAEAQQSAQAERQRRELLVAQRRAAGEARRQLLVAKETGNAFQLTVEEQWAAAQRWEQQGEEAYQQERYAEARQAYETGAQQYEQVTIEGERRRQRAEEVRTQAEQAREAAQQVQVQVYAGELFRQGEIHERVAAQAYTERRYGQSAQRYTQAVLQYEKARVAAAEGRLLHEQAVREKSRAEEEQQRAVTARGEQYAAEPFQQACTVLAQGEAHLGVQRWEEAKDAFARAREGFARSQGEARAAREAARQAAEEACARAERAQREATAGEQLFPGRWAEAKACFRQAQQALGQEDYRTAQTGFAQATSQFQHIHQDALIALQKEQAARTRARVQDLRNRAAAVKGRQKRRADKIVAGGELLFQQGKYLEAQASFEEAVSLLTVLQPHREGSSTAATIRGPAVYASGGALAFGIAIALYWGLVARSPSATTSDVPTLPPPPEVTQPSQNVPSVDPSSEVVAQQTAKPEIVPRNDTAPTESAAEKETEPQSTQPQEIVIAKATPLAPAEPTPPPTEPPLLERPLITKVVPDPVKEVTVQEGQELAFSVGVEGTGPLRYTWYLDGKKQTERKEWTYQPDFDEGGEKPKTVKVVVSAGGTPQTVEQVWQVRVQDVNRPPLIARASPKASSLELTAGEAKSLSVQASDPDQDDRLTYVWSMDGKEMARGGDKASWQIPDSASAGQHEVTAEVVDKAGRKNQVAWNVTVTAPAQPPRITAAQPRDERVVTQSGTPLDFSVAADAFEDSAAAKKLVYLWSVNNTTRQKTETGRFRFTETKPGTYQVTAVAISPDGLQSSPRKWTIEVRAPRVVTAPPPPGRAELSEAEIRNWLETNYRQAWEGKDVDALVQLGEVPSQEADRLKDILNGYRSFSVALRDIDIRRDGKNRAIVKFTRVDTVDGRTLPHPPKQLVIEKRADGRISRR